MARPRDSCCSSSTPGADAADGLSARERQEHMSKRPTTRASQRPNASKAKDRTNLKRVARLSDAAVRKAVAHDPDTFVPDEAWLSQAKLVKPRPKKTVTLRIDPDILSWFRKRGPGYQTRINSVLRAFVQANASPGSRR
jgi:uncharacterized protein (DUF4415 family)